jgi:hypothetical protein
MVRTVFKNRFVTWSRSRPLRPRIRILILDLFSTLTPVLLVLALYFLVQFSDTWADVTVLPLWLRNLLGVFS